jgi:hypothetical protein
VQISWGKPRSFPRSPAGFTAMALDGYGLRDWLPARPTIPASDPIPVRRVAISLHASFRRSLAVPPLRFARTSPPSGCTGDFHPQAAGHAQHTAWPCGPTTAAKRRLFDRAGLFDPPFHHRNERRRIAVPIQINRATNLIYRRAAMRGRRDCRAPSTKGMDSEKKLSHPLTQTPSCEV